MELITGGGGERRRRSSSDEKVDSPNLRDFLRVNQDDDGGGHRGNNNSSSSVTLGGILTDKRPNNSLVNRTLLDIIRDDPTAGHSRKTWRTFKDKLRLRRAGAAWTSSVPTPASDVPIPNNNRMISRRNSTRFPTNNLDDPNSGPSGEEINRAELNSMQSSRAMMMRHNSSRIPATSYAQGGDLAEEAEEAAAVEEAEEEEEEEPPMRMSLMALLAETDRQMGIDGSPFMMDDEDEEEEEEEEEEVSSGVGEYNNCCVCMVRHKGAAFIPCGHTFCRLCSRELWVQRGNCPLCNNFILEILDIF